MYGHGFGGFAPNLKQLRCLTIYLYKLKINGMFRVWQSVISVIFHGEILQFYFQVEFSKYMHVVGTAPTVSWLMKILKKRHF